MVSEPSPPRTCTFAMSNLVAAAAPGVANTRVSQSFAMVPDTPPSSTRLAGERALMPS